MRHGDEAAGATGSEGAEKVAAAAGGPPDSAGGVAESVDLDSLAATVAADVLADSSDGLDVAGADADADGGSGAVAGSAADAEATIALPAALTSTADASAALWRPLADSDPRRIGPYRILGVLGAGAMGRVYVGQEGDGAPVAVKAVRADLAEIPMFRKRFARESAVVRRIGGERIARVVAADADAAQPWLATELVPGPSLQSRIDDDGPLADAEIRALAFFVAQALVQIHAADVVHRDLKPSNVLLGPDGPKVIDFGVAHASDASVVLTGTGHIPGTPAYMSPEQAEARSVGPETDVFALGSMLVFAATGRLAFGDGAPLAVLNRVLSGTPDVSGVAERDPQLRALILACLAKDPARRPRPREIVEVCDPAATHVADRWGSDGGPVAWRSAAAVAEAGDGVLPAAVLLPTAVVGAPGAEPAAVNPLPDSALPTRPIGPGAAGAGPVTTGVDPGSTGAAGRRRRKLLVGSGVAGVVLAVALATALYDGATGSHATADTSKQPGGAVPAGQAGSESSAGGSLPTGPGADGGLTAGTPATTAPATAATAPPGAAPSSAATSGANNGGSGSGGSGSGGTSNSGGTGNGGSTPPHSNPPPSSSKPPANRPPATAPSFTVSKPPNWFGTVPIDVNWQTVPGATAYEIRITDDFGSGSDQTVAASSNPQQFNVPVNSNWCIWMRASNQYGSGPWSGKTCGTAP